MPFEFAKKIIKDAAQQKLLDPKQYMSKQEIDALGIIPKKGWRRKLRKAAKKAAGTWISKTGTKE